MSALLIFLLFAGSVIALLGSLGALFFKSHRRKAKWIGLAGTAAIILSVVLIIREQDGNARAEDYTNFADLQAAKKAGVTDVAAWQSQRQKAESERVAAAEASLKTRA
jgi:hypothetical protein